MTAFCSIVEYTLTDADAAASDFAAGEALPGIVIRSGDDGETLQVFGGSHTLHIRGAREGDGPGMWKHSTLSAAARQIHHDAEQKEHRRRAWGFGTVPDPRHRAAAPAAPEPAQDAVDSAPAPEPAPPVAPEPEVPAPAPQEDAGGDTSPDGDASADDAQGEPEDNPEQP
jgi:hypothetical protein